MLLGYCWVEIVDGRQAYCHFGDGVTGILATDELEPVTSHELPGPERHRGSFEAARAEAFRASKLLVVAVVSGRGKPVKEEALQYMTLASDEVRTVLKENAVFWRGKPAAPRWKPLEALEASRRECRNQHGHLNHLNHIRTLLRNVREELRDAQLRQLSPVDTLPSLAIAVTLAADAMTVILALPGAVTKSQVLASWRPNAALLAVFIARRPSWRAWRPWRCTGK